MSVYNEEEVWLRKSIESILNQTYKNIEFIIVLDNPNNITIFNVIKYYLQKDNRIIFIKNNINIGLTKSLNKAIKVSKGDYIARMDADDISVIDRLEKQLDYIKNNNGIELVASNITYINEDDKRLKSTNYKNLDSDEYRSLILDYDPFPHPTWMFKVDILKRLSCYRDFNSSEDYDFLCRAMFYGVKCNVMEDTLLLYRVRENGITKSNKMRQIYETERIKRAYCLSMITNYNFLKTINIRQKNDKGYRYFENSFNILSYAKTIREKSFTKYYIYLFKAILLYPKRAILRIYIFILKYKYRLRKKLVAIFIKG